jgi:L-threonylcarbamoyladenylate synthase
MATLVLPVDRLDPDPAAIARAAGILRAGGLVAFPTETVYGLGANALDESAVGRIFAAKGRPADNPVIVHAHDVEAARRLTADWPEAANRLAARFWPGPLTLVLPRSDRVPAIVTAGGWTVAVRVPAHAVALALIRACGLPVAAPSANRSNRLSPTRAQHVLAGLDGRIDMLLDAGPTSGGLESTVLDLTCALPRLLRPGLVSPGEIEAVIGPIGGSVSESTTAPLKSPGLHVRHYAPRTPLECVAEDGGNHVRRLRDSGLRVGWLTYLPISDLGHGVKTVVLPDEPRGYAAALYAALHEMDAAGLDRIVVALPPRHEQWMAVLDRLQRASAT